jgi:hypothetical protein
VLLLDSVVSIELDLLQVGPIRLLTMFSGVGLGAILGATHSLTLVFQASVLACVLGLTAALIIWPDPSQTALGLWVDSAIATLADSGASPEQLAALSELSGVSSGLAATGMLVQLIGALMLGYWCAGLAGAQGQPGAEFRSLRLGKFLGVPATLLMASSLVLDATFVQNLFPLVLGAFCVQGLAVTHAWVHAKRWNPAVLLLMYLLLVSPLMAVMLLVLGSMGLTDNWINLRAFARPAA